MGDTSGGGLHREAREQAAEALKAHTWWLAGNLGVPGMPDQTTYKCNCGWSGDDPHEHQADAVLAALNLTEETRGGGGIVSSSSAAPVINRLPRRRLVSPWVEEQP